MGWIAGIFTVASLISITTVITIIIWEHRRESTVAEAAQQMINKSASETVGKLRLVEVDAMKKMLEVELPGVGSRR